MRQFYDELVEGIESKVEQAELSKKPLNKIIKFSDSDSSGSDGDDADDEDTNNGDAKDKNDVQTQEEKGKIVLAAGADGSDDPAPEIKDNQEQQNKENEKPENHDSKETEAEDVEPTAKRQCVEADAPNCEKLSVKVEQKSVDKLIEDELKELGDKSKVSLRQSVGVLYSFKKL